VTYTADGVHLDLVNLVRQDVGLIIAEGAVAFDRCSDTMPAHPIMFTGDSDASLQLPGTWSSTAAGSSLQLTLVTNEPDGLLFYVLLEDEQSSFLAVELFEGSVFISNGYYCIFVVFLRRSMITLIPVGWHNNYYY